MFGVAVGAVVVVVVAVLVAAVVVCRLSFGRLLFVLFVVGCLLFAVGH